MFDGQTPALKKKTLQDRKCRGGNFYGDQQVNMKKAAEKLLDKVVTERLKNTALETERGEDVNPEQSELLYELKNYSEMSSEIGMDYLSDEGH